MKRKRTNRRELEEKALNFFAAAAGKCQPERKVYTVNNSSFFLKLFKLSTGVKTSFSDMSEWCVTKTLIVFKSLLASH